ncbi:nucleotide-diphospho-sugar transferase [Aureobasidium pullulans]|nr:nucleotide-diphospho-sugar transferase [Aureobasidium pullulans]
MYPEQWSLESDTPETKLLQQARDHYNVKLVPIHVQRFAGEATWGNSFTKLLAFNQTQYERVIILDSDANVLQPMDELFFLPRVPVAMPRAYWLDNTLSSQSIVIEPSQREFKRILDAFDHRQETDFDMEIVNNLYGRDCLILPHRDYDLLTGEFRSSDHHKYLGSKTEVWEPHSILRAAKFLHFSD